MRVVADTNIIISMLLWGKSLERLLVLVNQNKIKLCFSVHTIDELFRVIHYPKIQRQVLKADFPIERFIDRLLAVSLICYPEEIKKSPLRDVSDNRILEVAVEVKASAIISGDKHLLDIEKFRNIPIYSPAEFIKFYD